MPRRPPGRARFIHLRIRAAPGSAFIFTQRRQKASAVLCRLAKLETGVAGLLRDPNGFHLIVAAPEGVRMMADWPVSKSPSQLASLGGWAYGLVNRDGVRELWRSDGTVAERVFRFTESVRPFALTSGEGALWALSGSKSETAVLKSADGRAWSTVAQVSGGKAYDLLASEGALVVTGAGADGQGIVWGRFSDAVSAAGAVPVAALHELLAPNRHTKSTGRTPRHGWMLSSRKKNLTQISAGRSVLWCLNILWRVRRRIFLPNAFRARAPPARLTRSRDVEIADRGSIGAFWLLWGLGLAKNGTVPPNIISAPWTVRENGAAKYFEPQLMHCGRRRKSARQTARRSTR